MNNFKNATKGQLIMACGTGKTLPLWIREEVNPKLTVVFVPSISLLKQVYPSWLQHRNADFKFITVCSDKTVGKDYEYDQSIGSVTELGIPTTTNPKIISKFMMESGNKVIFSTYQSSHSIKEAQRTSKVEIDLMILDEAHILRGKESSISTNILGKDSIKTKNNFS